MKHLNSHPCDLRRCTVARELPPTRVCPQQRSAYCKLAFKLSGFNCVEPPYLLSQCKHRSLAPPPSWSELHSAFSWTRIASFHSCASFLFPCCCCLQVRRVGIARQLARTASITVWRLISAQTPIPMPWLGSGWSSAFACWKCVRRCQPSYSTQGPGCALLLPLLQLLVTLRAGAVSPASDVSGLEAQCPPFTPLQLRKVVMSEK